MMWTMPWRMSRMPNRGTPKSRQFCSRVSTWRREVSSAIGFERSEVGTLWSGDGQGGVGRRTVRPDSRRPSKACGLVTS
jgi:hypothetical protein